MERHGFEWEQKDAQRNTSPIAITRSKFEPQGLMAKSYKTKLAEPLIKKLKKLVLTVLA